MIAGRYTLEDEVGRGGMGIVWRATDELLGREVALKRIGMMPGGVSPDAARAEREARLAASLNHPNVVAVFDLVTQGTEQWLVMEYVASTTLAQLVRDQGPLPPDSAARLLSQAADALAAAHQAGIVHRDVKPSNILVTPSGQVKLTDFGIARATADHTLTQTGLMSGSPAYLSPEVASGSSATAASDVWALGATLFHALTGRPPYDANGNVMGALYQIVHEEPPRPPNAGWLLPLLEATMAKNPADRWTMDEVRDFLAAPSDRRAPVRRDPLPAPEPPTVIAPLPVGAAPSGSGGAAPRSRRVLLPLALAAAAVVVAALVGWALLSGDDERGTPAAGPGPSASSTDQQPEESPSPSVTTEDPAEAGAEMEAFVADYLATVTSDPDAAWGMLTPGFQAASGGIDDYKGFWEQIESAELDEVTSDPEAMTVQYTVTYQKTDGSTAVDTVRLQLTDEGGDYRIAGEA